MNMRDIFITIGGALVIIIGVCTGAHAQYWKVADDTTSVWSLDNNNVIPSNDAAYLEWLAAGNRTTPIASSAELYDVIAQSHPTHLTASAPALDAYGGLSPMQAFMWRKESGLAIIYTDVPSLSGLYAVDDMWLIGLTSGALLRCGTTSLDACSNPMPFGAATYTYLDKQLQPHTMSIVQMRVISLAIEDHMATLYAQLVVALGGGSPVWPSLTKTVP